MRLPEPKNELHTLNTLISSFIGGIIQQLWMLGAVGIHSWNAEGVGEREDS